MANNSIGAYAQGGSNDIGAYEKAEAAAAAVALEIILYYYKFLLGSKPADV
jgi:hypothetical protein